MYVPREIEVSIFDWIEEREIIAITGPRQSGKTTLLQKIREKAISDKLFKSDHIIYITLEDELERLDFEKDPSSHLIGYVMDEADHLFLIDEVQYVENAGRVMKLLFDKYHDRFKFVITGSSSPDLRNIGGALVGRVVFFELHPFSFGEFLLSKDEKLYNYYQRNRINPLDDISEKVVQHTILERLNGYLREYLIFGGFPRVVLMKDIEKKKMLLRQLITLYVEKDILKIHGQHFRNDALRVVQYLAYNSGGLINIDMISSDLGIDAKKVTETIDILELSFIVKRIRPFFKNMTTELRKANKIYFMDNGIRNVLIDDFNFSREKGFLLENHVFSELNRKDRKLKYWRTTAKAEVDFIFDDSIPIEVKATPRITRSLRSFITRYNPSRGLIVNYDIHGIQEIDETRLLFLPASLL